MHNVYIIFTVKNLLHVSSLLGHLQGEQFYYTRAALIQLSENVPLTLHCVEKECEHAVVSVLAS
jgi:hypothetical protein